MPTALPAFSTTRKAEETVTKGEPGSAFHLAISSSVMRFFVEQARSYQFMPAFEAGPIFFSTWDRVRPRRSPFAVTSFLCTSFDFGHVPRPAKAMSGPRTPTSLTESGNSTWRHRYFGSGLL